MDKNKAKFYVTNRTEYRTWNGKRRKHTYKAFIFECMDTRLILHSPSGQSFNEMFLLDKEDFMHYYYNLEVETLFAFTKKPKNIFKKRVTEFGVIPYLAEFISYVLKYDVSKNNKKYILTLDKDGEDYYVQKEIFDDFFGILKEDGFTITKTLSTRAGKQKTYYDVLVFSGDRQLTHSISCALLENMTKANLRIIQKWANAFVNYSIKEHQKWNKEYAKSAGNDENYAAYIKKHIEEKYPDYSFNDVFAALYGDDYDGLKKYNEDIKNGTLVETQEEFDWLAYIPKYNRYYVNCLLPKEKGGLKQGVLYKREENKKQK